MKVPPAQTIRGTADATTVSTRARTEADRTIQDRVTVNPPPQVPEASIAAGKQIALAERAARLSQLKEAVKSGHYVPDAQQIADRFLDQALEQP